MKKILFLLLVVAVFFTGCSENEIDFNNPDVNTFVKQLKAGTYVTEGPAGYVEVPDFKKKDIPLLLEYADDMTVISDFPSPPVAALPSSACTVSEGILWTIETIRLGRWASLGCRPVYRNAEGYERSFFLSEADLKEMVKLYRAWWETVRSAPFVWSDLAFSIDPLAGSNYRWW